MTELVLVSSALILICSVILWVSKTYNDGILGRAGLGLMSFFQIVILAGALIGDVEYTFLPEVAFTHVGMALFLLFNVCRHLRVCTKDRRFCAPAVAEMKRSRARVR